jgi:hypothetical protein
MARESGIRTARRESGTEIAWREARTDEACCAAGAPDTSSRRQTAAPTTYGVTVNTVVRVAPA